MCFNHFHPTNRNKMQRILVALTVLIGAVAISQAFVYPVNELVKAQLADDDWNPLPDDYQTRKAADKLKLLWEQVKATQYEELPAWAGQGFVDFIKKIKVFFNLNPSLDTVSDVMPANRPKAIHTYGVIGQIEVVPVAGNGAGYTGIFEKGGQGVIRMSLAADPSGGPGFLPGIGVKLLRDGLPSANTVANHNLDGEGKNANFFSVNLNTWLPKPSSVVTKILFFLFSKAEADPGILPVTEISRRDTAGNPVDSPKAPPMLSFVPVDRVKNLIPADTTEDIRNIQVTITPGPLYKVMAQSGLDDTSPVHIADINLINESPIASDFGDRKLFFQHQRKSA